MKPLKSHTDGAITAMVKPNEKERFAKSKTKRIATRYEK